VKKVHISREAKSESNFNVDKKSKRTFLPRFPEKRKGIFFSAAAYIELPLLFLLFLRLLLLALKFVPNLQRSGGWCRERERRCLFSSSYFAVEKARYRGRKEREGEREREKGKRRRLRPLPLVLLLCCCRERKRERERESGGGKRKANSAKIENGKLGHGADKM
jgi:hypothetical protein